jgi:hypothetical protein
VISPAASREEVARPGGPVEHDLDAAPGIVLVGAPVFA